MNTRHAAFLALSAGLLGGCAMTGPENYEVHEALLYGGAQERIVWVYGSLNGSAQSNVKLGDQALTLRPQVQDPFAVPGTLSVNGQATYRAPTSSAARKVTVTRDAANAFRVQANGNVDAVYYTDGQRWFKLAGTLKAGSVLQAAAQANTSLRGAGRLTDAEADALAGSLAGQGPLVVAVIPDADIPDPALAAQPEPRAYLRTGLYLQGDVPVAPSVSRPAPVTPPPANPAPSAPSTPSSGALDARVLERGTQSAHGENSARVVLATSQAEFSNVWRTATGQQAPGPSVPNVDFNGNSVVTFFLGQRPTGGYSVRFQSARASGNTLFVTVEVSTPGPNAITTQALTSPWLAVQVPGRYERVVVQDTQGRTLAQMN